MSGAAGARVCVYGAGAVGGHIAGRLARGGAAVSVVARGPHLAAIQSAGLTVRSDGGDIHARVAASDDPAALGVQDAVIVTVKAPALPSVAAGIAPLLGPATPVVFAMNGIPWWYFVGHGGAWDDRRLPALDPGDALRNAIGAERVVGGVVYSGCTVTAPGVVHAPNPTDFLIFGTPDGRTSPQAATLAGVLTAGGLRTDITPAIRDAIWTKLLLNLGTGPFAVLAQAPGRGFFAEPAIESAVRAVFAEGEAVARALGCAPEVDVDGAIARGRLSNHRPSVLQDLDAGRPLEIDGIYGAVQDLARLTGVATPVLDFVLALTKVRARGAGLYAG